jgi:hypothetical protein
MLKRIHSTSKTVSNEGFSFIIGRRQIFFQADSNCFLGKVRYVRPGATSTYNSDMSRIFRDGTKCGIAGFWGATRPDSYSPDKSRATYGWSANKLYNIDPFTGLFYGEPFLSVAYDTLNILDSYGAIDYNNGHAYCGGSNILRKVDIFTGLLIENITCSSMATGTLLFWTRDLNLLGIRSDYKVYKVSPSNGSILFQSAIPSDTKQVMYDYINDIIVCWRLDNKLHYYILEEEGSTLSAITMSPGTVKQYAPVTFSVTLTGSSGLPVVGAWVKWTIDPTTPYGSLSSSYSKTNSSGIATIIYIPPRRTGDTVNILAEVSV